MLNQAYGESGVGKAKRVTREVSGCTLKSAQRCLCPLLNCSLSSSHLVLIGKKRGKPSPSLGPMFKDAPHFLSASYHPLWLFCRGYIPATSCYFYSSLWTVSSQTPLMLKYSTNPSQPLVFLASSTARMASLSPLRPCTRCLHSLA